MNIEANSLSLDQVKGVIAGKTVFGPQKEIQEVKNAYQAYDMIGRFDPYAINDLKKLHGVMTYLTMQDWVYSAAATKAYLRAIAVSSWSLRQIRFPVKWIAFLIGWTQQPTSCIP